jgi:hypothetical protein
MKTLQKKYNSQKATIESMSNPSQHCPCGCGTCAHLCTFGGSQMEMLSIFSIVFYGPMGMR